MRTQPKMYPFLQIRWTDAPPRRSRKQATQRRRHTVADAGCVRLAYAILVQAISDAVAPYCSVAPRLSAADVRSAREFLASPAAHWLAAQLGLSLKHIRRRINAILQTTSWQGGG